MTDLLVIGGGAAGLMAAGAACARGLTVTLLEHNPKGPGQKLLITGKGRCNLTSDSDVREFLPYVRRNGRFLYSSLYAFPPSAAMELFETLGVPLKTERGRRVFPQSDRAADVLAALRDYARDAQFVRGSAKRLLLEDGVCKGAVTDRGETYRAAHTLIATGGISYPVTGSDGSGYKLARQAGHTIVPPQPSLCSLVSPDLACRRMMGLALRNVTLTLLCDGKPLFTEQGEALFTHFGLSGPLVLSASTYIEDITKHRYICEFDLKPALDEKTLYDRLTRDFAEQGSHSAQGALAKLLPNSMRPVAVEKWGVDPATKAAQITREQKMALVALCKHWQVPVNALGDKEHAVITAGGVDVRDYNLDVLRREVSMVLQKNVLFSGTILDNLRWGDENASEEECIRVAKLACADEFIERFPNKYNTWIEQGGSNVSGGQKQRLTIARALLRKPKVLILDDSTSAVDTATDAKIRKAFREEIPGTTKIIIAQRISSVQDADRILVLDNGQINGLGTHEELLRTNAIYQEVYNSQTQGGGDFDKQGGEQ